MSKIILELRSLPPKVEEMNNYKAEMEKLADLVGKEKRALTNEEVKRVTELRSKIDTLKAEIALEEETRGKDMVIVQQGQGMKQKEVNYDDLKIITPDMKFAEEQRSFNADEDFGLGDLVKVMAGQKDTKANAQKYVRNLTTATGSIVIPKQLAAKIFDKAREQSAVLGRINAVGMGNNNLTIAKVANDAEAHFVAEGDAIPASKPLFEGVTLDGKTMAIFVPVSEKLLSSANINGVIESACAKAIAVALDKALVYGDGEGENIKGIMSYDNINKVEYTGPMNYNTLLQGVKAVKKSNVEPSNIVINTDNSTDLSMLTDANGQYIVPPKALDKYDLIESNNIQDGHVLAYDPMSLLVGVNEAIKMEWGYTSDGFQRMIKSLRIYLRMDLGVINEKGVAVATPKAEDQEIKEDQKATK